MPSSLSPLVRDRLAAARKRFAVTISFHPRGQALGSDANLDLFRVTVIPLGVTLSDSNPPVQREGAALEPALRRALDEADQLWPAPSS